MWCGWAICPLSEESVGVVSLGRGRGVEDHFLSDLSRILWDSNMSDQPKPCGFARSQFAWKTKDTSGQSWSGRYFGRSSNNNKSTNRKPQTRANNFLYKRAEVPLNTAQILYLYLTFRICPECLSTTYGRRAPESVLALAHAFFEIKRGPGKERSIQSCNLDPHPK